MKVKSGFEFRAVTVRESQDLGGWPRFVGGYVALSEAMQTFCVYENSDRDFNVRLALLPEDCTVGEKLDHDRILKALKSEVDSNARMTRLYGRGIWEQWQEDVKFYLSKALDGEA